MTSAINIEGLSKRYVISHRSRSNSVTLREEIYSSLKSIASNTLTRLHRRKFPQQESYSEVFWALKDIDFQIEHGERLGIIGRNGAGKSTLLKILSRVTAPTTGRIAINGRVASLLEVGTGFHPELTGRENIYLNGAILGMTRKEISRKFDEIVDFADVERFLDTPVKRYSSGMYVRLAFSVAAHLEPEILIVDEVLAVGDAAFQKKCLGRMEEVGKEGRTVIFVSHNIPMISTLCDRALILEQGKIQYLGPTAEAIRSYFVSDQPSEFASEVSWDLENAPGIDELSLSKIRILGPTGAIQNEYFAGEEISIEITYALKKQVSNMRVVIQFKTDGQNIAFASTDERSRQETTQEPGTYISRCTVPANLLNDGRYTLYVRCGIFGEKTLCEGRDYLIVNVIGSEACGAFRKEKWPGAVAPKLEWIVSKAEL